MLSPKWRLGYKCQTLPYIGLELILSPMEPLPVEITYADGLIFGIPDLDMVAIAGSNQSKSLRLRLFKILDVG